LLEEALLSLETSTRVSDLHTLEAGLRAAPTANLAVLTIPGEYVEREAQAALESGLNLFIFSSNVPLEAERKLKQFATERKLLVMGPDCGTSILNGVGVGFANVVRRGSIGVIGPSGTGLQEFTCQIHNAGYGISQAIGTGSHDLSDEIGGITTFMALDALESDPPSEVIAIIAKPPGSETLKRLVSRLEASSKPTVACLLGSPMDEGATRGNVHWARTIDAAVQAAIRLSSRQESPLGDLLSAEELELAKALRAARTSNQRHLRGLFAGGTFCYQSQLILREAGLMVYSNAPMEKEFKLADLNRSREHTLIDMGDEVFTLGRPHPMIDGTLRRQRVLAEYSDPSVAVLLLDFILGFNAAMDPVGEILDAIIEGKRRRQKQAGDPTIVASICGTDGDSQDLELQSKLLREAEVYLFNSNAKAAAFCSELLKDA
jgi:succinyl-CoA synthetase alpha subunit